MDFVKLSQSLQVRQFCFCSAPQWVCVRLEIQLTNTVDFNQTLVYVPFFSCLQENACNTSIYKCILQRVFLDKWILPGIQMREFCNPGRENIFGSRQRDGCISWYSKSRGGGEGAWIRQAKTNCPILFILAFVKTVNRMFSKFFFRFTTLHIRESLLLWWCV